MFSSKGLLPIFLLMSFNCHASGYTYFGEIHRITHIPEHTITLIFVSLIMVLMGVYYSWKVAANKNYLVPDSGLSIRNVLEAYGEFIYKQCQAIIGVDEGPKYFGFIGFLFLFILMSNLIALVPGFLPPTENINTTFALGILTFIYYNLKGIKEQGFVNYCKHFLGPLWYMAFLILPIEIISNTVRPLSLALRLRGNMFGDHLVLGIFSGLVPYLVPILFLFLGLLVSFIQAYVFCVLTMVYIALATHHDHGEAGH
jgi:F-type H+-transporting ATPase subunit a